ncbi:OapA N-terminal domain-containing protein [Chitinophaga eiseniae]
MRSLPKMHQKMILILMAMMYVIPS